MKLVYPDLEYQIKLDNQNACEWIIESPVLFSKYVQEILQQVSGAEGKFVLSEELKEINFSKSVEVIENPLLLELNDKKILNKIYSDLQKIAYAEEMYQETIKILGALQNYFYALEHLNENILVTDLDIDVTAIFKAIGVKVEISQCDFFENLSQYIQLVVSLLGKKVIVFVNLRSYITDNQLEELLKMAKYKEIALLLIENFQRDFSSGMNRYIIDMDNCEIY